MMLRSSDNTDQNNEEYHDPTGLETPSRAQLPRMLSMTLAEFDQRVAEAIRAQTQNLVTSSTANRQNPSTPNRPRRGSHAEEATPPRQTLAEVSAPGLSYNAALESVLELKRLKLDLVLTMDSIVIVPGPGSRSYRVPTLPDPTGYYYCTLQLGCRIVVAIYSVHLEVNLASSIDTCN